MPPYVIIGIAVAVIAAFFIFSYLRNKKIRENGVEAQAVVARIDVETSTDSDGSESQTEKYYVTFQLPDGRTQEARLTNPSAKDIVGTQLKIKYLPEKPQLAVRVKE